MFRKFANFWRILFNSIKTAYNKAFKEPLQTRAQKWRDVSKINFLAVFVDKLSNLSLTEATFDIETDSVIAEPLQRLIKDVEDKRYNIAEEMLGTGDYYIFPATNEKGEIYNTFLTQQQVRILNMDGDNITEAYGIIDWYIDSTNSKVYYLVRHHKLEINGTLEITYSVMDDSGYSASVPHWEYLKGESARYENAGHIGIARFKSPASSRGLSAVYGVPLNFGCEEIENKLFNDLMHTDNEFKHAASKIFTDPRNLKADESGKFEMVDNIFAVNSRAGQTGANIDIYSPAIRYNEYRAKYVDDLMQYEQQVGVDRGFLTPIESGEAVTATAIKRANASTISMLDKIHTAFGKGVEDTIKADALFLNIADDLYSIKIDWYDPFDDPSAQWDRLLQAHEAGAVETDDLTRWMFPDMSPDEIEEKIARIAQSRQANSDLAIENILNGR